MSGDNMGCKKPTYSYLHVFYYYSKYTSRFKEDSTEKYKNYCKYTGRVPKVEPRQYKSVDRCTKQYKHMKYVWNYSKYTIEVKYGQKSRN